MSLRSLSWSLAAASLCLLSAGGAQAEIAINLDVTHVECNGGTTGKVVATPSGGTAPYSYSWLPNIATTSVAQGLPARTYTLTVTDFLGESKSVQAIVTQPTFLNVTDSGSTNVTTPGGSNGAAAASVSGGTPGYSFLWSPTGGTAPTATGLSAGSYTVTVTDANGCWATKSFTITQPVVAATVSSVGVPANATYAAGDVLTFTVNFSEAVTVNTSDGTPRIQLTLGTATRYADFASGSGTSSLSFQYIVQAGDTDMDGITIGTLGLNGGTIRNGSENANLTLNSVGSTTGVLIAPPAPAPAPVPTLTEWAMILLAGLLGLFGLSQVMQRRRTV